MIFPPEIIPAQQGAFIELQKGDFLKVTDTEGEQVADLFCFNSENPDEYLSSGRTMDYNEKIFVGRGDFLYSNLSRPLLQIVEDTCGRHDFLLTPCSLEMFQLGLKKKSHHPSCLENLVKSFSSKRIDPFRIGTTLNIFMNVQVNSAGKTEILAPLSKAGDFLTLQAQVSLWVGLTACSDEGSNNGRCKPITYEIIRAK